MCLVLLESLVDDLTLAYGPSRVSIRPPLGRFPVPGQPGHQRRVLIGEAPARVDRRRRRRRRSPWEVDSLDET